jgi:hypothetical protein
MTWGTSLEFPTTTLETQAAAAAAIRTAAAVRTTGISYHKQPQ